MTHDSVGISSLANDYNRDLKRRSPFQVGGRVYLIKLPPSPFFARTMHVGMRGTITAVNTPIPGYYSVQWDAGFDTDAKADTINPISDSWLLLSTISEDVLTTK